MENSIHPFSHSDFSSGAETEVPEKMQVVDEQGSTSISYIIRLNGKDYFMKRLRPELQAHEVYRNLYRKEFELGISFSSPYIVAYNKLKDDEEDVYILRENVVGATLKEKLATAPEYFHKSSNIMRLMLQLLEALRHIHERQVVHADLKPDNIMLTRINNDVKLIDFGFSFADKFTSSAGRTLEFAAPEQKRNEAIDARTDIYAFGVLMKYVYNKADVQMPKRVKRIVQRCMEPTPAKRFQRAEDIVMALQHRSKIIRKCSIFASIALVVAIGLLLLNRTYKGREIMQEIEWSLRTPQHDYSIDGVLYQIEAGDSTTTVVGGLRNVSLKISAVTTFKGKNRRTRAIAPQAFCTASHLQALHIPEGVEEIGDDALNRSGVMVLNLPKSIKKIGKDAFAFNGSLQRLYFADGIEVIPRGLAHHAKRLIDVSLPNSVRILEVDAFAYNERLYTINLPDSLERIERGVFWACLALDQVTLPATVKSIGEYAFYHCGCLQSVVLEGTTPPTLFNSFPPRIPTTFYVPEEAVETYKTAHGWREYKIKSIKEYVPRPIEELASIIYEEDLEEE